MNNICDEFIDNFIFYINKQDVKKKLYNNIFDPLLLNIQEKTYNYFITIISLYTIIILMQIIILLILLIKK